MDSRPNLGVGADGRRLADLVKTPGIGWAARGGGRRGGCHRPDVLLDPDLVAAARVGLWLAVYI
jgi:hypothetical protein